MHAADMRDGSNMMDVILSCIIVSMVSKAIPATDPATPSRREVTHARILDVAAREVRRKGCDGVGVAEVMKQAGLTHGGFYAHFASREAMLAEAIERAGRDSGAAIAERIASPAVGVSRLRALVEHYLSEAHLEHPERGCVVAALASEVARQPAPVAGVLSAHVRGLVALVRGTLPPTAGPGEATTIAATLVGSLQIARAFGANAEGRAVLAAARTALLDRHGLGRPAPRSAGAA